ncbi:MAG: DMT family transporter [Desulfobacterales bacterium]|nr:DMT family transporter [Desulfobacterales bacterium]
MNFTVFLLVLGSAFGHAGWNFAARKVSGNFIVLWFSLWVGCLFLLPIAIGVLFKTGLNQTIQTSGIPFIVVTGLIHAVYFTLLGISYKHGEISTVYPIARGSGVGLTAIFANLIYFEKISLLGAFGITLISLSILFMGFSSTHSAAKTKPLTASLCLGITISAYSLVDKMGVLYVHPVIYIWFLFFIPAIVLTPFIFWQYHDTVISTVKTHFKFALIIGIGSIITYLMILIAFKMGPLSYIVAVREFAVVFGALAGLIFLKEKFSIIKIIAIICITIGMICIKIV